MNSSIIRYVLGQVLKIEGILMLLPCLVALIYQESVGFYYLVTALLCMTLGFLMTFKKPSDFVFYLKEGCVTTTLSWALMSFFGAIPFWASGEIPSLTDALFETVSGFTTTGASILSDVEALSHCSLMWRSFTHWIGGMGVLVFLLAVIPMTGGSHMNLMRAESPGPSVGKLVPKIKSTARILYLIYFGLTVIQCILLLCGGMTLFDSLATSFGTAGTGGFGIKNDSIGGYSPYIQWVVTIFMILFGVNFNAYYLILFHQFKKAISMEEVRYYFLVILASIAIICVDIRNYYESFSEVLRHAAFQVGSLITTTGFSTTDFNLWPQTSKTILVLLMFIGACAGSTGGGLKISRLLILCKSIPKQLSLVIHPREIKVIKMDGKAIEHQVMRATNVYLAIYFFIILGSTLLVSVDNFDFTTNFTAVVSALNNIGPGLAGVGPTRNFGAFSVFSKFVLMFDMLAGRLELYPLLILFMPSLWRRK